MYRKVSDFLDDWKNESEMTLCIFKNLTDASLTQRVTQTGRSLGFLAWHITLTPREMLERAGLVIDSPVTHAPVPHTVNEIIKTYEKVSASVTEIIGEKWKDEFLAEKTLMYGEMWAKGVTLSVLIRHQTHHRGQMTVLMRQAGLTVPGAYGPAREEWAAFGMPTME
jgi:uncharacterized damage-inducible protein DinB